MAVLALWAAWPASYASSTVVLVRDRADVVAIRDALADREWLFELLKRPGLNLYNEATQAAQTQSILTRVQNAMEMEEVTLSPGQVRLTFGAGTSPAQAQAVAHEMAVHVAQFAVFKGRREGRHPDVRIADPGNLAESRATESSGAWWALGAAACAAMSAMWLSRRRCKREVNDANSGAG